MRTERCAKMYKALIILWQSGSDFSEVVSVRRIFLGPAEEHMNCYLLMLLGQLKASFGLVAYHSGHKTLSSKRRIVH